MSRTARATSPADRWSGLGEQGASSVHEARMEAILEVLRQEDARTVLDLGCGPGPLLARLVEERALSRIVGVDVRLPALEELRRKIDRLFGAAAGRVDLLHMSFLEPDRRLQGFDAAVLLETIEHIDPERLSLVERAVFGVCRPRLVLITTPNADYNVVYGIAPGRRRHWDHRFEWGREKFTAWAEGVAARNGYSAEIAPVGPLHAAHGAPTQMAVFRMTERHAS